jgi:SNF2 family DNA or RNA helicase
MSSSVPFSLSDDSASSDDDTLPSWVVAASAVSGLSSRALEVSQKHSEQERRKRQATERERERHEQEQAARHAQEQADLALARRLQREEEEQAAVEQAAAEQAAVALDVDSEEEVAVVRQAPSRRRPQRRPATQRAAFAADDDSDDVEEVDGPHPGAASSSAASSSAASSSAASSSAADEQRGVRDHVVGELAPMPNALRVASLFPYQRAALAWCLRRERGSVEPRGGLLADEQGLGKTVQMLSLCLRSPCSPRTLTAQLATPLAIPTQPPSRFPLCPRHAASLHLLNCAAGVANPQPLSASPVGAMLPGGRAALGCLIVAPLMLVQQWVKEIGDKVCATLERRPRRHRLPTPPPPPPRPSPLPLLLVAPLF